MLEVQGLHPTGGSGPVRLEEVDWYQTNQQSSRASTLCTPQAPDLSGEWQAGREGHVRG